jgi:hypothetical protein
MRRKTYKTHRKQDTHRHQAFLRQLNTKNNKKMGAGAKHNGLRRFFQRKVFKCFLKHLFFTDKNTDDNGNNQRPCKGPGSFCSAF